MKVTADTNVLVRAVLMDDPIQGETARALLRQASLIAVSLTSLCEFVWVLLTGARLSREKTAEAIHALIASRNVIVDRPAVEAGLAALETGGDFADAIIAYEGKRLGGETFVSFDRKAVSMLLREGHSARLLNEQA